MDDSNLRDILQETTAAFIDNNTQAVKQKDPSLFSAILTEDCIRSYRPKSFVARYPGFFKSQITNADYEAQMQLDLQTMKDVSQNVIRTLIDTTERAAVIWTEQTITMPDGLTKSVEVIWDLSFTQDGTRVKRILEFVDTWESTKVLETVLANAA